ncbi:phosphoglucomutase [Paenibacillus sp. 2RAB27]|uniref:phosphoglucomutase n=1 Tax=Paenibacillus sp. 2RAB27 TaxID=3232991 RepID=UPI003F99588F
MAYPDSIDRFSEKLNKKQDGSTYAIEEELPIDGGMYEGFLQHDNISTNSIQVYTGSRFTGDKVSNFIVSVPSNMPWRRIIKIFSTSAKVFVSYETPGDTVEADDINTLQASVTAAQEELDRYKSSGIIDGGSFFEGA